jgi:hypothetical protein
MSLRISTRSFIEPIQSDDEADEGGVTAAIGLARNPNRPLRLSHLVEQGQTLRFELRTGDSLHDHLI